MVDDFEFFKCWLRMVRMVRMVTSDEDNIFSEDSASLRFILRLGLDNMDVHVHVL